jgi:hypothetical protein
VLVFGLVVYFAVKQEPIFMVYGLVFLVLTNLFIWRTRRSHEGKLRAKIEKICKGRESLLRGDGFTCDYSVKYFSRSSNKAVFGSEEGMYVYFNVKKRLVKEEESLAHFSQRHATAAINSKPEEAEVVKIGPRIPINVDSSLNLAQDSKSKKSSLGSFKLKVHETDELP